MLGFVLVYEELVLHIAPYWSYPWHPRKLLYIIHDCPQSILKRIQENTYFLVYSKLEAYFQRNFDGRSPEDTS